MESIRLCCGGREVGELTVSREGGCTVIRAQMPDPGDGVYRLNLCGQQGQLYLGVMEPAGECLSLCRRPYSRDVARLGPLLRGEACRSIVFTGKSSWQESTDPARLLKNRFLSERIQNFRRAWWRREGELLYLAIPWQEGSAFPVESLFCLARICRVEGRRCVLYCFDGEERPAIPEKT